MEINSAKTLNTKHIKSNQIIFDLFLQKEKRYQKFIDTTHNGTRKLNLMAALSAGCLLLDTVTLTLTFDLKT